MAEILALRPAPKAGKTAPPAAPEGAAGGAVKLTR